MDIIMFLSYTLAVLTVVTIMGPTQAAVLSRFKRNGLDRSLLVHPSDTGSGPKLLFQTDKDSNEMMLNVIPDGPKKKAVAFTEILAPMVQIAGEPGGFKNLMKIFKSYMDSGQPIPNPFGEGTLQLGDANGGGLGKYLEMMSSFADLIPSNDPNNPEQPKPSGEMITKLLSSFLKPTGVEMENIPVIGSGGGGFSGIRASGGTEVPTSQHNHNTNTGVVSSSSSNLNNPLPTSGGTSGGNNNNNNNNWKPAVARTPVTPRVVNTGGTGTGTWHPVNNIVTPSNTATPRRVGVAANSANRGVVVPLKNPVAPAGGTPWYSS